MSDKETYSTDGMVCPYCDHLNRPEESHHYNESIHERECDACGETFETSCCISYSWSSGGIGGDNNE